jgi:1,4-dihydroxy-2-naphthoate octaprenyltransferase
MATATAMAPAQVTTGQLWFRALRAPFLVASVIPVILGGVLAWAYGSGSLTWGPLPVFPQPGYFFRVDLFLLTLVGAVFVHLATNMLNDNFDYRSGNDLAVTHQNPFAGGGRVLTTGRLSVNAHLGVAIAFLGTGSLIGLYLVTQTNLTLLWIGLVGVFAAFFYVAPPIRLANRGVGELFVGLSLGPLVVMGTYFVQTMRLDWGPLFLSVAFGSLVAAILWINEFPDVEADVSVGKRTLMSRLGAERSTYVFLELVATAYAFVLLAVITGTAPWTVVLTFLSLPLARKAYVGLRANYRDPMALIPANAGTIMLTMVFGILAVIGVAAGLLL